MQIDIDIDLLLIITSTADQKMGDFSEFQAAMDISTVNCAEITRDSKTTCVRNFRH